MQAQFMEYLQIVLTPFFKWWWVLFTGVATFLGYVLTPDAGFTFGRVGMLLLILMFFLLLFFSASIFFQGWIVFNNRFAELRILHIQKNNDLNSEFVFIFMSHISLEIGTLVHIKRRLGDVEVPFALVEIVSKNKKGNYQAKEISIKPAHLRDFKSGKCSIDDMVASPYISSATFKEIDNG